MNLSSIEQKIYDVLEPIAGSLGFEIVKLSFTGGNRKILDIAIDKLDSSGVTIANCRNVSNNFSAVLDVEEIIPERYYLEVGSAGVERHLVRSADYIKFAGRRITLKLHKAYKESKKIQCELLGLDSDKVKVKFNDGEIALFTDDEIKGANLVFTDEMFRTSLKKENKKDE